MATSQLAAPAPGLPFGFPLLDDNSLADLLLGVANEYAQRRANEAAAKERANQERNQELTSDQLAQRYGVPVSIIRAMARRKQLNAYTKPGHGRHYFFKVGDSDDAINARRRPDGALKWQPRTNADGGVLRYKKRAA